MKSGIWTGTGALAAAAAIGLAVASGQAQTPGILAYADPVVIAEGERIYDETCASCHGENLEGEPDWRRPKPSGRMPAPPHDDTGHTWHHPATQLFLITKHGTAALVGGTYESDMAGFAGVLSDEEILTVLAYIKSTWPARIIARHNDIEALR